MPMTLDETPLVAWPPEPSVTTPAEPPRRSRSRWRIVAVALVASVAGGGMWWQRAVTSDPGLKWDGAALNVFRSGHEKTGVTEVHNLVGEEARVAFEPGGTFSAWMGLYNGGPRAVTVKAFPREGFHYWGVERVVVATDEHDLFPEGDAPAPSFQLAAGDTRYVRVDFEMARCNLAGLQDGESSIASLPVTYRTLGVTRTVDVPFDDAVIAVATIGSCDRPFSNAG